MNRILQGNCVEILETIKTNSIDLIVTSPPYNVKKGYQEYNDDIDLESYYSFLMIVCKELFRIIKPNHHIFVNIADIGISNRDAFGIHKIGNRGNFYVIPHHCKVIDIFQSLGAQVLRTIIWHKPTNCNTQFGGNGRFCGTYPYPRNCHISSELEFIVHFRKNGKYKKVETEIKEASRLTKGRWLELSGQIWKFNGVVNQKEHPAQFPVELPLRCVEGWSMIQDVVLDPFIGFGTTAIACMMRNRQYLGIELSPKYVELANKRIDLWKSLNTASDK